MANLSFQDAEKIIRENPKQADALAFEAQEFLKTHPETSPTDLPQPILDGKTISEAYSYLRNQHEDSQMRDEGAVDPTKIPPGLVATPLLAIAFLQKPKIMEDDGGYLKTEERLKKEWLKNNNAKDFSSKEGIDYLYGSIDDRTRTSLQKETEEAFRNNPKNIKKLEIYDREKIKIYKNSGDDPRVQLYKRRTQTEVNARLALFEKKTKNSSTLKLSKEEIKNYQDQITGRVHRKYLREFAEKHPEKTKIYHERIKAAREINERRPENKISVDTQSAQGGTFRTSTSATSQAGQFPSPGFPAGKRGIPRKGLLKNPLKGLKNPFGFGKIGQRTARRVALRGFAAFLFNPITITLAFIVVLTFIIVFSGGAPTSPSSPTTTTTVPAGP